LFLFARDRGARCTRLLAALLSAAALGACSGPLLQSEPRDKALPSEAIPKGEPGSQAFPAQKPPVLACVRESEACRADGTACCPGFMCVGTRGAFCVSKF